MSDMKAYDPNITWAKQKVRLKLMQWAYSTTLETTVGGNCQGFNIFVSAVSNAWLALPTRTYAGVEEPISHVILKDAEGNTLECEDYEMRGEDWLAEMIVGVEIIGQEEHPL